MADNDEVPLPLGDLTDIPDQSFEFPTFISYEDTLDFGGVPQYNAVSTPLEDGFSYDFSFLFEDNFAAGNVTQNVDDVGPLFDEHLNPEVREEGTHVYEPVNEEIPIQDTRNTNDHQINTNGTPGVELVGESIITGMAGHTEIPTPLDDSPDLSSDFVGGQPSQLHEKTNTGGNHMNDGIPDVEVPEESLPTGELMSLQQSKRFPGKLYQFVESTDGTMVWNQEGDAIIFHASRFSRDEHVQFGDCYKGKFKGFWTKLKNYGFNRTLSPDDWLITNKFFLRGKTYLLQCIKRGDNGAVPSSFSNTMDNTSVDPALQSKMVEMLMDRQRVFDIMAMLNDAVTSYSCKVNAVLEHTQGR